MSRDKPKEPKEAKEDFDSKFGVKIPSLVLHGNVLVNKYEPVNNDEIMDLINRAYEIADEISPTGTRTPLDMKILDEKKKELERDLRERNEEEDEAKAHSHAWQAWAAQERKKTELSVKREKLEKMKRLHEALKNPEIKELLLMVMNRQLTPQQAFADIKAKPDLHKQMMSLTLNGRGGGKSRVFRRKNKKMTSTSKRNVRRTRHTRRHRKSSTRRSTRK